MKKLLFVAGDKAINPITMDFTCYLAKLCKSKLTGIFPKTMAHQETLVTSLNEDTQHIQALKDGDDRDQHHVQQMRRFEDACISRGITGWVHTPVGDSWKELIAATQFADAIIIDSDFTLHEHILEANPSHWAKKLLHESRCPVIVAPLSFDSVSEIILTFDGSKSSLAAIREFIHLFVELQGVKVTILQIWLEEDEHPEEQQQLLDWIRTYFSTVESVVLEGPSYERLTEYIMSHPGALVVMGGFGRSRFSRILQPSASGHVVKLVASPLFISHD